MRYLYLNSILADIDDKTVIGFDLQSYDIKDPGRPKVVISNNFTIPATAKNKLLTGFAGNPQTETENIYNKIDVLYTVDNDIIIEQARARIEKVTDRIELFIFKKSDVWDEFKKTTIQSITSDLLTWLSLNYGVHTSSNKYVGTLQSFIEQYNQTENGLRISYYFGNLSAYQVSQDEPFMERPNTITLRDGTKEGGHVSLFILDFFKFLESKYDIDFQTEVAFDGNIFLDSVFSKVYVPFQQICTRDTGGFYFDTRNETDEYLPLKDAAVKSNKSIYDLLTATFKHFNILMDSIWNNGTFITRLYRFDDISDKAPVINWSGSIQGGYSFMPTVSGYGQKTYIKFSKRYEGAPDLYNAKTIICENQNIDAEKTITEINAFACGFTKSLSNRNIPVLNTSDGVNEFTFFRDSLYSETVEVWLNSLSANVSLKIPGLLSLDDEYTLIEAMIARPKMYEIEKWLKISDVRSLLFFAQYYIEELGGSFFIDKIKAFNPSEKSGKTKISLIKVGNKTPRAEVDGQYWKDGQGNRFVDGFGNYFTW